MTATTKKYMIWGAVIVGAYLLYKHYKKSSSSSSSMGTGTGTGVAVSSTAATSPANAGAAVPTADSAGKNPAK